MYDLDEGYKVAELTKNGDEQRLKNGRKLAEMCNIGMKYHCIFIYFIQ